MQYLNPVSKALVYILYAVRHLQILWLHNSSQVSDIYGIVNPVNVRNGKFERNRI